MRLRLVLAIAGVAALAVVLFAVPLALVLERIYRGEELLRLQRDTVAATRQIDIASTPGDPLELPADPKLLAVYDTDGRRIAGRGGPGLADAVVRDALRTEAPADQQSGGQLVVAVPLVVNERLTGVVRAERSDADAAESAHKRWWFMAGVAAAVVGLAILAAVFLGRRLARPLEQLAVSARRLGEGDFDLRAPPTGILEVDEVARALNITAGRLDDLVTRERAFSANASHQLRTPLAALRLELETMELNGDASPELPAALAQVDRLQETIETLLSLARGAPANDTLTPLRELLEDARSRWQGPLAAQGRTLSVWSENPEICVRASPSVLREILDVLLDNAVRHGSGAVELQGRRSGGSVAIDIGDEGAGPPLDAEQMFARSAGAGGHGIGLALARSLAHAEGGRLLLSRPAPPVFTLFLPIRSDDDR
ncbi:MAG: sensor histidine kinase [Gaiellaceae bacterium]